MSLDILTRLFASSRRRGICNFSRQVNTMGKAARFALILVMCLVLGALWGALPVLAAPAPGSMQVVELSGKLLQVGGGAVGEYDYLRPGLKYRLPAGARVILAPLKGESTYSVQGPGVLEVDPKAGPTLDGKPLQAASAGPATRVTPAAGGQLGAVVMRGQSGVTVAARDEKGQTKPLHLYSGYHALVVGCSDYTAGWPKLPNPVADARQVAQMLRDLGWQVTLVENPQSVELRRAFNQLVTGPGKDPDQAVLLWFSGHGHTMKEADGTKLGYLVPVDAPLPARDEMGFLEKSLDMRRVETLAKRIQAKHVLMLFDSCFSGAIFSLVRAAPSPHIMAKTARPVRQFITAGNQDEQVPDSSVFKTVFIQGIQQKEADLNGDGYITGEELGAYLQDKVVVYSNQGQHPQYGKINNPKLDKGDFVITLSVVVKGDQATPAPAAAAPATDELARERARLAAERQKLAESRRLLEERQKLAGQQAQVQKDLASLPQKPPPAPPFPPTTPPTPGSPEWEVQQSLAAWVEAWNARDYNAIMGHYAPGAIIMTLTGLGVKTVTKNRFKQILGKKLTVIKGKQAQRSQTDVRISLLNPERALVQAQGRWVSPAEQIDRVFSERIELARIKERWLIKRYQVGAAR